MIELLLLLLVLVIGYLIMSRPGEEDVEESASLVGASGSGTDNDTIDASGADVSSDVGDADASDDAESPTSQTTPSQTTPSQTTPAPVPTPAPAQTNDTVFIAYHGSNKHYPECVRPAFSKQAVKHGHPDHLWNTCTPHHIGGWINKGDILDTTTACCPSGKMIVEKTGGRMTWGTNRHQPDPNHTHGCEWHIKCKP